MRRISALLLAALMLLPLFLPSAGAAAAGEGETAEETAYLSLTKEEVAARFLELKAQFPDGKYWNRAVTDPYRDKSGNVIAEVFESVTDHKCDRKNYVCKGQCVGYAWMIADLIFLGSSTGKSHTTPGYTRITDRALMDHVEPGDIISGRCDDFNHEAIVWKVENGKVYVTECWGSTKSGCRINWFYFDGKNKYATWDAIKKATADGNLVLYRHPPYAGQESGPADGEEPADAPQGADPASGTLPVAYPSAQTVLVDGEAVEFHMYALMNENGDLTNYVPLRQLAGVLSGTDAQFDVGWTGSVNLITDVPYTPNGRENDDPFDGPQHYAEDLASLRVDGAEADAHSITLTDSAGGGYTYFKLRELGDLLGFAVDWSAETGITVRTGQ